MKTALVKSSASTVSIPTKTGMVVLAFGILLFAFVLRVWQIDGPYEHFDEKIAVYVSQHLEKAPGWDDNWKVCEIPVFSGVDQYNFSAYLYATHLFRRATAPFLPQKWNRERLGVVSHRLFSVLCGTAAVGLMMLTAWRLGGGFLMAGAGMLTAVNVQLVEDSHYARPESFMSMLFAAVVCLGFLPSVRKWRAVGMAGLIGLLTAVKFTNALFLILPAYALWQAWRDAEASTSKATEIGLKAGAGLLAFVIGWALGVPYALIHPTEFISGVKFLAAAYTGVFPPYTLPDNGPSWSTMRACFVATHGWPLLIGLGLGSFWCVWRRRLNESVLLILPVGGLIVFFGIQKMFVERNLSPVLPVALLLAAIGFGVLARMLWRNGAWRIGTTLVAAVLVASITGDRAVWLLLRDGVTETESSRYNAYWEELKQAFPKTHHPLTSLYATNDMDWLKGEVGNNQGEVLLTVFDFNDAYKKHGLAEMGRLFNVFPVAEYRGTFADYPLSGLNSFHGMRLRTYLVRKR